MILRPIPDRFLAQTAYLVGCPATREALIVDPERDVDRYVAAAALDGLRIVAVAETHVHADFLSGAHALADLTGARLYLSAENGGLPRWADGRPDVTALHDGDTFAVGRVGVRTVHTPGHTPEHVSFVVTDGGADEPMGVLSGDFVFAGALGRPDLLESAVAEAGAAAEGAAALFGSVGQTAAWADWWQVWPGHGAGSACGKGLSAVPQTTMGYERRHNAQLAAARDGAAAFARQILDGQNEPPLYFARTKRANRDGVPALASVPTPRRVRPADLPAGAVVLDTRPDRSAFMRAHLPGALHTPLDAAFCTAVGSLVPDPDTPLALVAEPGQVDDAVRALVRIGFDRVEAFATPADVEASGLATARIEEVRADGLADRVRAGAAVLDVRYGPERAGGSVPGSVHVPYTRLAERLEAVPRGRPVLVHCASGVRSAAASAFLAGHGVEAVYVNGSVASLFEGGG